MRGIADGCAAALDGRIKIHDQIIAVCSVCVVKHIRTCIYLLCWRMSASRKNLKLV